ncbi:MAG: energy transducer TonB [Prevotella sp.]|nr:energy transducer TonB [Prevotella sp.]MCM1074378.1 energy transducer TonB [Ruminococcus sp.]
MNKLTLYLIAWLLSVPAYIHADIIKEEILEQTAQKSESVRQPVPEEKIFTVCEVSPNFPGGTTAMMKFISEQMQYPEEALRNGIEGRTIVQFVVEKDGTISNVETARGTNTVLDEEALRIVKAMPKFTRGTNNGIPVRCRYLLPITFKLPGKK